MNILKKPGLTLLAATMLLGLADTSSAATVYLRDTPNPTDHFVFNNGQSLKRAGVGTIDGGNYWAGTLDFQMNLSTGSSSSTDWFSLWTYCIDPFRALSVGSAGGNGSAFTLMTLGQYFTAYTPAIPSPSSVTNVVEKIEKLWANAFVASTQNATTAAAFQFLLWEYIADGTFDLSNGRVKVTNTDVRNQAIAWNTSLAGWTERSNLQAISGFDTKQSFIYPDPRIPTNENVPEPGTYAMLGAGLLVLGYWRRRK